MDILNYNENTQKISEFFSKYKLNWKELKENNEIIEYLEEIKNLLFQLNLIIISIKPDMFDTSALSDYTLLFGESNLGEGFRFSQSYSDVYKLIDRFHEIDSTMITNISKVYKNFLMDSEKEEEEINDQYNNFDSTTQVDDYSPHILLSNYIIKQTEAVKSEYQSVKEDLYLLLFSLTTYLKKNNDRIIKFFSENKNSSMFS